MPGHHGKSGSSMGKSQGGSHGDKGNNNRESYRTSTSYQKSVSPTRVKTARKEYELATGRSRLDNLKVKKVPSIVPFSSILNAGQKFRQKTLDKNVEYFKGLKSRGKAGQYDLTDEGYKSYMKDRSAGKIDAAGNVNPGYGRDRDNNIQTQKVVGGRTILTETPTQAEVAESEAADSEYDARKTKRRGRRRTILTSQRGASGNLVLGKPTLLGA